ncbi:MAG: SlyX family protein [Xanthomonadaceae bacterium]|nr:SlyX family protein [Xanthomonadaceae bacterium]
MTANEERLVELETRLAFQEHALNELSEALADIRAAHARQALALERALADLRQLRTVQYANPADEPPPPHY